MLFSFFPDLPQMMTWPSLSVLSCLSHVERGGNGDG